MFLITFGCLFTWFSGNWDHISVSLFYIKTHVLLTVNNPLAKLTSYQWNICQQHFFVPIQLFLQTCQKLDFLWLSPAGNWETDDGIT